MGVKKGGEEGVVSRLYSFDCICHLGFGCKLMIRSFWKENDIEDEAHNEVANTKRAKVFREHEQDEDAKLGRKRRNSLIDEEDWPIPRSSVFEATKSEEPTEHQQDFKRFNSGEKMEIEDEEGGGHFAMGLHEKDFLHEY